MAHNTMRCHQFAQCSGDFSLAQEENHMSAPPDHRSAHPNRRTLLKGLLHGGAVLGAAPALLYTAQPAQATATEPSIKQYKPLGSTDMRIADVSFGASRLQDDPDLVRHAFDRGINYFDTAESYTGGTSEETIGQALQGKRDKVFLTSKGANPMPLKVGTLGTLRGNKGKRISASWRPSLISPLDYSPKSARVRLT